MSAGTKIEWTDFTFNPWWGCMKVSEGCKYCYAEKLDNRYHNTNPHWGPKSTRKPMGAHYWKQPAMWNRNAEVSGLHRVFCASMADVFEYNPYVVDYRLRLFELIRTTPNLTWQLLTKRPENIELILLEISLAWHINEEFDQWIKDWINGNPPKNVWIGTSVENQAAADKRIPELLSVPAKVHFLSCEPLLGPVNLEDWIFSQFYNKPTDKEYIGIDWVIAGGESGYGARPMHPDWARSLRDQCKAAEVPFFFKQWGQWHPLGLFNHQTADSPEFSEVKGARFVCKPDGKHYSELYSKGIIPDLYLMESWGKKDSGNQLDGQTYQELPIIKI